MAQIDQRETTDDVVREIRRIKEALAEAMRFDVHRILEEARGKQKTGGRKVLPPQPGSA